MKKKTLPALALTALMTSCGSANAAFNFGLDFSKGYNKNLWYKNDLQQQCADPSIIYCEEDQYYYMYMTSDELGATGFNVYRSKQLNYWEKLAPAFLPDPHSWGITQLWAPNVIKIENQYYLYYSAYNHTTKEKGISVAVCDTPAGPFHEFEGFDAHGKNISRNDQIFDFGYPTIDAAPFIDDDGQLYLYYSKDQVNGVSISCGVKLIDPVTMDASTATELCYPAKSTFDGETDVLWEKASGGMWNEAPFMLKENGKYFLTYSANPYWDISYGIGYAVGNSPLGPFTKPHSYECENLLLGVDPKETRTSWDFMSGTGHHCFFYAGDELMIGYHAHIDRYYGNSLRAFALDKMYVDNDRLFVNGPTYSLQPLPESVSGYKNIAKEAKMTVGDNVVGKECLVDGKVPMHQFRQEHVDLQAKFPKGEHKITFEFDNKRKITAVAIYNSLNFETAIKEVKSVEIAGFSTANNIPFNYDYIDYYMDEYEDEYIRPGCPFVVEFKETETSKITITIDSDKDFALSDIVILGR